MTGICLKLCKFARDTKTCHAVVKEEKVQILRADFKNLAKQATECYWMANSA